MKWFYCWMYRRYEKKVSKLIAKMETFLAKC